MFEVKRTAVVLGACALFALYGELSHALLPSSDTVESSPPMIISLLVDQAELISQRIQR